MGGPRGGRRFVSPTEFPTTFKRRGEQRAARTIGLAKVAPDLHQEEGNVSRSPPSGGPVELCGLVDEEVLLLDAKPAEPGDGREDDDGKSHLGPTSLVVLLGVEHETEKGATDHYSALERVEATNRSAIEQTQASRLTTYRNDEGRESSSSDREVEGKV
jgi:hypothetical protein